MKKFIAPTLSAAAPAVSGCNTIPGMGRDVRAVRQAVTTGAESARNQAGLVIPDAAKRRSGTACAPDESSRKSPCDCPGDG